MPRVLSGIQPTGRFHWGNYFGAIRQYIDLQDRPEASFYFIADLHALTTLRDAGACGATSATRRSTCSPWASIPTGRRSSCNPEFPKSASSCWVLLSGAPMGLLERCVAYKDKKARGLKADAGTFCYPVLMAADILIYDSDIVPVGEDQVQHIEVARDLAGSFNHEFGETFVLPKPKVLDSSARVSGMDGQKMSKSYGNTLAVFEEPKALKKQIMRIVTDSRPPEQPKPPEGDHLYELYSLFATKPAARRACRHVSPRRLRLRRREEGAGRDGKRVFRRRAGAARGALRNPQRVREILGDGAATARKKAAEVLLRAEKACGLRQ